MLPEFGTVELVSEITQPTAATVTKVRSTLLSASIIALTRRGLADAYWRAIEPRYTDELRVLVAGTWIPVEIAMAHYTVLQGLVSDEREQFAMGSEVGDRIQASLLGTLLRAARATGITPWTAVEAYPRLYQRCFDGGWCGVYRCGPKDALFEQRGVPMIELAYFRNAWMGMAKAAISLFSRHCHVQPKRAPAGTFRYLVSWV